MGTLSEQSSLEEELLITQKLSECEVFGNLAREIEESEQSVESTQIESKGLSLLERSVPGMRALSKSERDAVAKCFREMPFPAGHVFLDQGERARKAIYVVSDGSVGRYCRDVSKFSGLPMPGVRRQDVLGRGRIFGSLGAATREPFSVRCSKPCKVFCIRGEGLKKLPDALLDSIRQHLAQDAAWHTKQIEALPNTPSVSPTALRRSLSSSFGFCSHVPAPAKSPLAVPQTHCKIPTKTPDRMWLEELDQVLRGCSRLSVMQPPLDSSPCTSDKSGTSSLPWLSGSSSMPSLAKAGASTLKIPAEYQRKCPTVRPFLERSFSDSCRGQKRLPIKL